VLVRKWGPQLLALLLPCAVLPAIVPCTNPQQPLLRSYLLVPGAEAEDKLYSRVAVPFLDS
jgi:hypothetical protein